MRPEGGTLMRCGKLVRCWDFLVRPCRRPLGHMDEGNPNCHNPFSDAAPTSVPKPPASSYKENGVKDEKGKVAATA